MGFGFDNAISEITLVFFTALAPSGIVACIVMMAPLLSRRLCAAGRAALNKYLALPILVALVGLVASATHLGNPANALYVLTGVGRSPLSDEVFAAAVFFGLAGSYWFYSFSRRRRFALERAWVVAAVVSGVAFLVAIAFAYRVDTVPTWSHPYVPAMLLLDALTGGPLLAVAGVAAACAVDGVGSGAFSDVRTTRVCLAVSAVALVCDVVVRAAFGSAVLEMRNSTVTAAMLVPHYHVAIACFALACAAAIALNSHAALSGRRPSAARAAGASALALVGIFAGRFVFYMLHMTVGLSF